MELRTGYRRARVIGWGAGVLVTASLAGCGARPDPTLPPEAFVNRRPAIGPGSNEPIDRAGALEVDAQHAPRREAGGAQTISPTVQNAVQSPSVHVAQSATQAAEPPTMPATAASAPSTAPAGITTAQYQVVGAVLAEVNGKPIFADKVLSLLDRPLSAEARKYGDDRQRFRAYAADMVHKTIIYLVNDEVEFAAADKSLDKKEKELATMLTIEWRKNQTRAAGGSEAEARRRFAEQGQSFEDAAKEEYRKLVEQIYLQRKIIPLVQVNAQDLRRYYQDHLRDYSVAAAARFRVIKIDVAKSGSREKAVNKAAEVYQWAAAGEDFAELAGKFNDDPRLMERKGAVGATGWMEKGEYVVDKVDEAVWKMKPGEVSPPIDTGNALYLVKLEELKPGRTKPFENSEVQEAIKEKLFAEQFHKLEGRQIEDLKKNAVVVTNPGMEQIALEMVMQRYPVWMAK